MRRWGRKWWRTAWRVRARASCCRRVACCASATAWLLQRGGCKGIGSGVPALPDATGACLLSCLLASLPHSPQTSPLCSPPGFNSSIFVYGQTGAGKTHTITGDVARGEDGALAEQCGLTLRVFRQLFDAISDEERGGVRYTVKCRWAEGRAGLRAGRGWGARGRAGLRQNWRPTELGRTPPAK